MSNIVLIGFMGSGKTTVAKTLSKSKNMVFIDTDIMLASIFDTTIPLFIEKFGIKTFRYFEYFIVSFLSVYCINSPFKYVISTGGGIVLNSENKDKLSRIGKIFWLDSNPKILWSRVSKKLNKRPLLNQSNSPQDTYFLLYKERKHLYKDFSDYRLDLTSVPFFKISSLFT